MSYCLMLGGALAGTITVVVAAPQARARTGAATPASRPAQQGPGKRPQKKGPARKG